MNSTTYFNHIKSNTEEFKKYYELAKQAEEHDNPEDKPLHILAKQLNKLPSNQRIADLGCGDATLSTLCPNHKFTNIDAYGLNDMIQVYNLTELPKTLYKEFDVVVLSRAMWATNKEEVMQQAIKLLKSGGTLYVCEPFKRWNPDFITNKLEGLFTRLNLHITWKKNTTTIQNQYPKFMYYALSTFPMISQDEITKLETQFGKEIEDIPLSQLKKKK